MDIFEGIEYTQIERKQSRKHFFDDFNQSIKLVGALEDRLHIVKHMSSFDMILVEYLFDDTKINNALHRAGIFTIGELLGSTIEKIKNVRWLGKKSLEEIEETLKSDDLFNISEGKKDTENVNKCITSFVYKKMSGESYDQIVRDLIRDREKQLSYERRMLHYGGKPKLCSCP